MYDAEAIGRRLKSGLVDNGYTNEEFAELMGVSRFTVDNWCSGRTELPFRSAIAVCELLNWPLDRLARREPTVA